MEYLCLLLAVSLVILGLVSGLVVVVRWMVRGTGGSIASAPTVEPEDELFATARQVRLWRADGRLGTKGYATLRDLVLEDAPDDHSHLRLQHVLPASLVARKTRAAPQPAPKPQPVPTPQTTPWQPPPLAPRKPDGPAAVALPGQPPPLEPASPAAKPAGPKPVEMVPPAAEPTRPQPDEPTRTAPEPARPQPRPAADAYRPAPLPDAPYGSRRPTPRLPGLATSPPTPRSTPPPAATPPPRVSLQAFMEAKNIRWGELVSGLLIVVSVGGLVVSLWSTLQDVLPYFPALLLTAFVAALFGAGHYTRAKWALPSTSFGLLTIATLLAPLNFLLIVALAKQRQPVDGYYWLGALVATAALGPLLFWTGRTWSRRGEWTLTVGVLGTSALILSTPFWPSDGPHLLAALLPTLTLLAGVAVGLSASPAPQAGADDDERLKTADRLLAMLAATGFAWAIALVAVVTRSGAAETVRTLAPLLPLFAWAVLRTGLEVRRLATAASAAGHRLAGESLIVAAAAVVGIGGLFAWPDPAAVALTAALAAAVFWLMALRQRLEFAYPAALLATALAAACGRLLLADAAGTYTSWGLVRELLTGATAAVLLGSGLLAAAVAWWLRSQQRHAEARWSFAAGVAAAGVAVLLATVTATVLPADVLVAALTLSAAVGLLVAANRVVDSPWLTAAAGSTLGAALWVWTGWHEPTATRLAGLDLPAQPALLLALLLHAAVAAALTLGKRTTARSRTWATAAAISSLLAGWWLLPPAVAADPWRACLVAWWLTAVALLLTATRRQVAAAIAFQALSLAASALTVGALCRRWDWWSGAGSLLDVRHASVQLAALAAWLTAWEVSRREGTFGFIDRAVDPYRTPVRRTLVGLLVGGAVAVGLAWCLLATGADGVGPFAALAAGLAVAAAGLTMPQQRVRQSAAITAAAMVAGVVLTGVTATSSLPPTHAPVLGLLLVAAALAIAWLEVWEFATELAVGAAAVAGLALPLWLAGVLAPTFGAVVLPWCVAGHALLAIGVSTWWTLTDGRAGVFRGVSAVGGGVLLAFGYGLTADPTVALGQSPWLLAAPALLLALAAVVAGVFERREGWLAAGWFAVAGGMVASHLLLHRHGTGYGRADLTTAVAGTGLALALYGLLWKAVQPLAADGQRLIAHGVATAALVATPMLLGVMQLVARPDRVFEWVSVLGGLLQTAAVILAAVGVTLAAGLRRGMLAPWLTVATLPAFVVYARCGADAWPAYHALQAGLLLAAAAVVALACLRGQVRPMLWLVAGIVAALALRATRADATLWPPATLAALAVLLAVVGSRLLRQSLALASIAAVVLATGVLHLRPPVPGGTDLRDLLAPLAATCGAAACLAGIYWLGVQLLTDRRHAEGPPKLAVAYGFVATPAVVGLAFFGGWAWLAAWTGAAPDWLAGPTVWRLAVAAALLLAGCLYDRTARAYATTLAVWLGAAALLLLARRDWPAPWLVTHTVTSLAALTLVAGLLWAVRVPLLGWGRRQGMLALPTADGRPSADLVARFACVSAAVLLTATWHVLTAAAAVRWQLALTTLALPVALAPLAASGGRSLRRGTLLTWSAAVVLLALATVPGGFAAALWLDRAVQGLWAATLAAIALLTLSRRLTAAERIEGGWRDPARAVAGQSGMVAAAALIVALLLEVATFLHGGVPLATWQVVLVSVTLVAGAAALVYAAVRVPDRRAGAEAVGHRPRSDVAAERSREWLVYGAELVAALLFVHLRLCVPSLFAGVVSQYWPLILMALAFVGVAAAEWLRSTAVRPVGTALGRTGLFLPLLPVLGFWVRSSAMPYFSVWLAAGLVYALVSTIRRSPLYGLVAGLMGNVALWLLLADSSLPLWQVPQVWLIPPALSVLVAAQFGKAQLDAAQLAAVRYACGLAIYVSSTAHMFLHGIGDGLLLPMVLLGLSVAGVLCGMWLRVRAFLYLGFAFTVLSLLAMVGHAAQSIGHVWPWWAFGIGVGLAVLVLFGWFEKRRGEALHLVEDLRSWEA